MSGPGEVPNSMKKDAVEEQRHKLNTMELTDDELAILAKARKNIGVIGMNLHCFSETISFRHWWHSSWGTRRLCDE
jgi:hypothetical protein